MHVSSTVRRALVGTCLAVSASWLAGTAGAAGTVDRAGPGALRALPAPVAAACGQPVPTPDYTRVLWVVMENAPSSAVLGAPAAPFTTALARACGLARRYTAVTHPSLPNYLALTAGTTFGIEDDNGPSAHRLGGASIFSQVLLHHLTWASFEESMPARCAQASSGLYAVKHNPAAYFVALRAACQRDDMPMGTATSGPLASALRAGRLPSFTLVTPNVCDDGHSCPLALADAWLGRFVTSVVVSRAYRGGRLAVFVTWDEGSGSNQVVPLLVVAPSVPHGTVAMGRYSHYSLLRTTEALLGLPPLRNAAHAASMVPAFHL